MDKCPFCGKDEAKMTKNFHVGHQECRVWCENCGSYGPTTEMEDCAARLWNQRADKPQAKK